jgi:phosphoribosylanthranilate isomerase
MGIQVKICGVTSAEAADAALRAGADFAGLVFHPGSPRNLGPVLGARLADGLRGRVKVVALLADANDDLLLQVAEIVRPDFFQLHGSEAPDRVAAIRSRFGKPIIKAVAVADASDLATVAVYEQIADMLLFDAKAPSSASRPGGHGASFDWQLLRGRRFSKPWLLAGGLDADNVARAIASAEAPGVDVSSGVETTPGVKSVEMIRAFVAAARTAQFASAQP